MKISIKDLQTITQDAKENNRELQTAQEREEVRRVKRVRTKYVATAKREASMFVESAWKGVKCAAEQGLNYYTVCQTENNNLNLTVRDEIIMEAFTAEGFNVSHHLFENEDGCYDADHGGWMPSFDCKIVISW